MKPLPFKLLDRTRPTESGCIEWRGALMSQGYGRIRWKGVDCSTHRLAYELAYGEFPKYMLVCHRCDNRKCINPAHLFLGTHQQNTTDMVEKKRSASGERNGMNKLSTDDIRTIRKLCEEGANQYKVAFDYGVKQAHISNIVTRKRWAHIE